MIKIERNTASKATILRNGVRQPVTLNMTVTQAELDSLEAEGGTITYSVDELEIKTVDFRPAAPTAPAAEPPAIPPAIPVAAATPAKPIIQPARKTAQAAKA